MASNPDAPNPLAPNMEAQAAASAEPHPLLNHAAAWKHVSGLSSDDLASQHDKTSYATPLLGGLASNPKVKLRDVIKAASEAAAAGKIKPSEAVDFISSVPQDPQKLRPWLVDQYKTHLSALIHMKAAMMPAAPQPGMPGGPPMGGAVAAPGGAPPALAPAAPPPAPIGVPPR